MSTSSSSIVRELVCKLEGIIALDDDTAPAAAAVQKEVMPSATTSPPDAEKPETSPSTSPTSDVEPPSEQTNAADLTREVEESKIKVAVYERLMHTYVDVCNGLMARNLALATRLAAVEAERGVHRRVV